MRHDTTRMIPGSGRYLRLFAVSLVVLLLELALIRWLPSQVRALAYFKNLVLISSFLGLGVGFLARRPSWLADLLPLALAAEVGAALVLGAFRITGLENQDEHLWLLYYDLPETAPSFPLAAAIPIFYALNTLTFVPLGRVLARAMDDVADPLLAYIVNLAGGLAGTLAFVALSFGELGPRWWFVPPLVIYAAASAGRRTAAAGALAAAALMAGAPLETPDTSWSPYYAVRAGPVRSAGAAPGSSHAALGFDVSVNGSFHQAMLALGGSGAVVAPELEPVRQAYLIPYRRFADERRRQPASVLVLGAGTGNDAVVALSAGATSVDAVEIDPVILRLGEALHPDHPYADRRVRRHVDDARSFLRRNSRQYDMVVYGTLDSQVALSALSTIRLDNFVYTVEGLREARRALAPGGMVALYFWAAQDWIVSRLFATLQQAFEQTPEVVLHRGPGGFNLVLMVWAAPATRPVVEARDLIHNLREASRAQHVTTDDWPYLYLRERSLGSFYVSAMVVLTLLSIIALRVALWPKVSGASGGAGRLDWPLFCQGAGFLLLETRSISVMALVFGSTWLVSAVAISAILLIVLLGNMAVRRRPRVGLGGSLAGLAATLALGYLVPAGALLSHGPIVRLAGSIVLYLSPVFFSSVIFAVLFRQSADRTQAYASNLIGAVMGGFAEYLGAVTGLRALSLLALAAFAPIAILRRRA